jgi:RNA polymerase sigma-70 factor (ECF subfamily)
MELPVYSQMICYSEAGVYPLKENSEDLPARVRSGDESAFGQMFEQYHRFVLRFIYGMVGDHGLAEELTQETFMGAYRNRHLLRGDAKLSTWLCGIAKNVVSKSFRSRRHEHLRTEIGDEELLELRENSPLPDKQLLSEELSRIIRNILLRLDEDWRTVFVLKVFQQLSYEEISEITGSSIPKLKTDLHRAKAEVRRLIRPYLEVQNEV